LHRASAIKKRPRCCSGPLGVQFQGSSDGVTWITLYSATTTGNVAEVLTSISSNLTTGNFQQHRFAIQSQGQPIAGGPERERNAERRLTQKLINAGYRILAAELHPDRGGTIEEMVRLNKARERLRYGSHTS
jgi:hypothetical protein